MPTFKGQVIDAGGGEVRILVSRDAEAYPAVGDEVTVAYPTRPHAYVRSGRGVCAECGLDRWAGVFAGRLVHYR